MEPQKRKGYIDASVVGGNIEQMFPSLDLLSMGMLQVGRDWRTRGKKRRRIGITSSLIWEFESNAFGAWPRSRM
jgi:hypothetical protein